MKTRGKIEKRGNKSNHQSNSKVKEKEKSIEIKIQTSVLLSRSVILKIRVLPPADELPPDQVPVVIDPFPLYLVALRLVLQGKGVLQPSAEWGFLHDVLLNQLVLLISQPNLPLRLVLLANLGIKPVPLELGLPLLHLLRLA